MATMIQLPLQKPVMDHLYWFSLNCTITTIDTVSPLQGNQSEQL